MDRYQELAAEYGELRNELTRDFPDEDTGEELLYFYMAASLKIWGSNVLYSPDYGRLLSVVSGTEYTMEQVMTAMGCCADPERRLKIPDFLRKLTERDIKGHTDDSVQVLGRLSSLFVGTAMINGDFTVEEAGCLSGIMDNLVRYVSGAGVLIREMPDFRDRITERKEDSYLQNDGLVSAAGQAEPPAVENGEIPERRTYRTSVISDGAKPFPVNSGEMPERRTYRARSISDRAEPPAAETDRLRGLSERQEGPAPSSSDGAEPFPVENGEIPERNTYRVPPTSPEAEPEEGGSIPLNITIRLTADPGPEGEQEELGTVSREEAPAVTAPPEADGEESMESLLRELDGLVGLENVKQDVHSLMNFIKVAKIREARGMKVPTVSYHLVFTGNPGTGKTTVARLVAKLYYQMGILPKGQLVETDRSALVAGYLGQTAIKTQKVIQQAMGGVLFIDEAYSLAGETDDSYGREAIETILKAMEDHRDELVVIVAGYTELMHKFISSNPGLNSRFSKYFEFPDYTGEELSAIFGRFCETNGYVLGEEVSDALREKFDGLYAAREEHFGNARTARNIFEKAIHAQADRIAGFSDLTDEDLANLTLQDVLAGMGGNK